MAQKKISSKPSPRNKTHLIIPDTQCKPGVPLDHCGWAGQFVADRQPDVVVCLGDWWDMPSLSSYDKGKKSFEGRRYKADIEAGRKAMELFMAPMRKMRKKPRLVFLIGNHEQRIQRAIEDDPKLDGTIGYQDFGLDGWEVYPFLQVVVIDGIAYSHFFPRSANGSIAQTKQGAPDAKAQLMREGRSCTAGHKQGLDIKPLSLGGRLQWGLIAGSFYQHDEDYLSPQGNDHWRGLVVKHQVKDGYYDPMIVGMDYLRQRYGK